MEGERIRLRLHWGGRFDQTSFQGSDRPALHYVGGDVFNESVHTCYSYAEFCRKLNDKVGFPTSIKYLPPFEDLGPNELVSVSGDDDLQELFDEYLHAVHRPGTPVKTFRIRVFLFPAQDDSTAAPRLLPEEEQEPFNPEEWCMGSDDDEYINGTAEGHGHLADSSIPPQSERQWEDPALMANADAWDQEQQPGVEWLQQQQDDSQQREQHHGRDRLGQQQRYSDWQEQQQRGYGWEQQQQQESGWAQQQDSADFMPAFPDWPDELATGPSDATRDAGQELLSQHAIGNLLLAVSLTSTMQRPMGITQEIDLMDPYHEEHDEVLGAAMPHPWQRADSAAQQPLGMQSGVHPDVLAHVQDHPDPKLILDSHGYSSLIGKLPSHISVFGSEEGQGGRALSAGADDGMGPATANSEEDAAGPGYEQQGKQTWTLPSHISVFGSEGGKADSRLAACGDIMGGLGGKEAATGPGAGGSSKQAWKLPSHISAFGSVAGSMLSTGMDDGVGIGHLHVAEAAIQRNKQEERAWRLPSHISAFGSSSHGPGSIADATDLSTVQACPNGTWEEVSPAGGQRPDANCLTQEFALRPDSGFQRPSPLCLDEVNAGRLGEASKGNKHGLSPLQRAHSKPEANASFGMSRGGHLQRAPSTPKLLEEVVRVPLEEVHIIRKIGEGAFGEVSLASVQSHGLVAVKWLKKDRFAQYSASFVREAEVLAKLNHPNIIRMYGLVVEPVGRSLGGSSSSSSSGSGVLLEGSQSLDQQSAIAGIMTDYVRGGSLARQLRAARRRPTLRERCQVAVQAARGMAFLHAQNPAVIHFDLKPDNLLVDGDGETLHVKVADFGLSKHKFQNFVSCRDLRGTLPYMAPELVSNPNQVCEKCDVWSMGVVMWEMYTLEVPYRDLTAQQILVGLLHGNLHLHVPSACEPEWRGLIEMCMDLNPEARPSFRQVTTHLDALLRQLAEAKGVGTCDSTLGGHVGCAL